MIRRNKWSGLTVEEHISRLPAELPIDAVGFWQIAPVGRESFQLQGAELVDFVRRGVLALFAAGARPVRPSSGPFYWEPELKYGTSPEEMARTIIDEWLASGKDPDPSNSIWFALPELYLKPRADANAQ